MNTITGKIWCFGDHVNTDVIHPPDFFSLDPERVRQGLFHNYDPTMQSRLAPNDMIVSGRNFGCGSSRETSVQSLKLNQVGAIIAVDFGQIFFRNATNNGIPCLTFKQPDDLSRLETGEMVELSIGRWQLKSSRGEVIELQPASPFIQRIWQAGGLLNMVDQQQ